MRSVLLIGALVALAARSLGRPGRSGLTAAASGDLVESLPGWGKVDDAKLYAGYVTVNASSSRQLYYTFVESRSSPSSDPLVLWLNGGPGCSSIGGGFLSELGPWWPTSGGELQRNPFAWNRRANVIFLDSPAFVGFSWSALETDRVVGDERTAADNLAFLLGWLERFPQFSGNDFWLAGESYAGHYIPQLAEKIVAWNKGEISPETAAVGRASSEGKIPLQGFVLGNPLTDTLFDNKGALEFWFTHGIISRKNKEGIENSCNLDRIGPLAQRVRAGALARRAPGAASGPAGAAGPGWAVGGEATPADSECERWVSTAQGMFDHVNIYDIYADVCLGEGGTRDGLDGWPGLHETRRAGAARSVLATAAGSGAPGRPRRGARADPLVPPSADPCVDDEVSRFLNREEVQEALHVPLPGREGPVAWRDCTHDIAYSYADVLSTMLPTYKKLLGEGLRLLVFTGDVDAILPVTGTRAWIRSLSLEPESEWREWFSSTGQVGGWTVDYSGGFSYATVRGAGHMVPYTQPERALHLFERFVSGRAL